MMPLSTTLLVMGVAYLIGAIPFAYLLVRWRKGIDIRTVGSGNVGATNAGRVLGFRYFLLTFALDLTKGLLPTVLLPRLTEALRLTVIPGLPVLVALATILGHNFPVYLGFRGGKGVATTFGALLALDPIACLAALAAFLVVLGLSKFVSLSSVAGALAFVAAHFARTEQPWSADERAMSIVSIALALMLIVRHRANFRRILAGTEPRIGRLRKRPPDAQAPGGTPDGRPE